LALCCGVLLSDEKSYLDDAKIVLVNDLVMNYASNFDIIL
jgi:hypothetical protein